MAEDCITTSPNVSCCTPSSRLLSAQLYAFVQAQPPRSQVPASQVLDRMRIPRRRSHILDLGTTLWFNFIILTSTHTTSDQEKRSLAISLPMHATMTCEGSEPEETLFSLGLGVHCPASVTSRENACPLAVVAIQQQ